jgi:hypothetical protein
MRGTFVTSIYLFMLNPIQIPFFLAYIQVSVGTYSLLTYYLPLWNTFVTGKIWVCQKLERGVCLSNRVM